MDNAVRAMSAAFGLAFSDDAVRNFTVATTNALNEFVGAVGKFASSDNNELSEEAQRAKLIDSFAEFLKTYHQNDATDVQPIGTPVVAWKRLMFKKGKTEIINPPKRLTSAAKRPLNSWMAFRSYYKVICHTHGNGIMNLQKDVSGGVRQLWERDMFRSKWTLIARAYSTIRDDVGKRDAPLKIFLDIVCPHLDILDPDEYFDRMGWEVIDGKWVQADPPTSTDFSTAELTTTLSVQDILNHCIAVGFYHPVNAQTVQAAGVGQTLAMATMPTGANGINIQGNGNTLVTAAGGGTWADELFNVDNSGDPADLEARWASLLENEVGSISVGEQVKVNATALTSSMDDFPHNIQFEAGDFSGADMTQNTGLLLDFDVATGEEPFDISQFINIPADDTVEP